VNIEFHLLPPREQADSPGEPYDEWLFPDGSLRRQFFRLPSGYLLRFHRIGDFHLTADGLRIDCAPAPGVSESAVRTLFRDQVAYFALSKQGELVFHASAVETPWGALAFSGESRRGKSTLAAHFALNGFGLLTDDGLVFEKFDGYPVVRPGHASVRLWNDSKDALAPQAHGVAALPGFAPKFRVEAQEGLLAPGRASALKRMYFLGSGEVDRVVFERLSAADAWLACVKNCFLLDMDERSQMVTLFERLSDLVPHPIHYRLDYPRRYAALDGVREAIIRHAFSEDEA
jgi:hypothetical protein